MSQATYWNEVADEYQEITSISINAFHLGPLLPCATDLGLISPDQLKEKRCLEVGSGAGQNSIFLAKYGANCTAIDVAEQQLAHGRQLAAAADLQVDFRLGDLDTLAEGPTWDFVHSTYALPFANSPTDALRRLANAVAPGGRLVVTTGHPLFAGEWLEVDGEGEGMFVRDYFQPPFDPRFTTSGDLAGARQLPVSTVIQTLIDAGLTIASVLEPEPIPLPELSEPTLVPYYSEAWAELYPQIAKIPVVLVVAASKPAIND